MGDGQVVGAAMAQAFASTGRGAVYQAAPSGPVLAVLVLDYVRDEPPDFFGGRVSAPGWKIELLQAAVPVRPVPGATLTLDDGTPLVVRSAMSAAAALTWLCDCDLVVAAAVPVLQPAMLPFLVGPVWVQ